MESVFPINDISSCNAANNHETYNPLISVIDFSKSSVRDWGNITSIKVQYGLYCIYLKDVKCGDLKYGREYYDYQAGTLVFFAPGQTAIIEKPEVVVKPKGHGLIFHPDLIFGTELGKNIHQYKFFDYETNEALHLSEYEKKMMQEAFAKIEFELKQPIDKHSKKLITANIGLLLDYCQRFYDRQFITRDHANKGILEKFEKLLQDFFNSTKAQEEGLPSVAYCAGKLNLSPNYFGDLIKKETGNAASDYIHLKIIDKAKQSITGTDKSVSEIAYELGFKYPQHFTRLFKQKTGITPIEFRNISAYN